jgi:release factor glutamine methyltransferase
MIVPAMDSSAVPVSPGRDGKAVRELIAAAVEQLEAAGVATAQLDAEVLLADSLQISRAMLHAHPERNVADAVVQVFDSRVGRRQRREPVAHILGRREFWSLDFEVTADVLIPRPETELVVELAKRLMKSVEKPAVCDVGTGSGCIAIAIAKEMPDAMVVATDVSSAALQVARRNAARHAVEGGIELVSCDLFSGLTGRRFELIVSNPPYIDADEMSVLSPEVRREPAPALNGGVAGLQIIRRLIAAASEHLCSGGWLLMEIGATQGPAVEELARDAGYIDIRIESDYAGLPRVLVARAASSRGPGAARRAALQSQG